MLKEVDIITIRKSTKLQKDLAEMYGICQVTVSDIKLNKSWKHIKGGDSKLKYEKGEQHHNSKVTERIVKQIRKSNLTNRELANKYGISPSGIWGIRNNRIWKHIGGNRK